MTRREKCPEKTPESALFKVVDPTGCCLRLEWKTYDDAIVVIFRHRLKKLCFLLDSPHIITIRSNR